MQNHHAQFPINLLYVTGSIFPLLLLAPFLSLIAWEMDVMAGTVGFIMDHANETLTLRMAELEGSWVSNNHGIPKSALGSWVTYIQTSLTHQEKLTSILIKPLLF